MSLSPNKYGLRLLFLSSIAALLLVITPVYAQTANGVVWDLITQIPSPSASNSWFPDLAVDRKGDVHIVWSETGDLGFPERGGEGAYYTIWNGKKWMQYVDLIPPHVDIVRTSIAIDGKDQIHLLYDSIPPFSLYHKSAPADQAYLVNAWSAPKLVNEKHNTYFSDVVAFDDYIHIVYDDGQFSSPQCELCANIYYRNSPDSGKTWSNPVALYNTTTGSSRAQIDVDSNGGLYIAWDEGWDRLTGLGNPEYGVFIFSKDQGETWSDPLKVDYPNSTNMQLTVGADGKGGIMLVWRSVDLNYPSLYFIWSQDYGKSWSSPQTISNFMTRDFDNFFDVYDMATDSNGHIHLVAVGYLSAKGLDSAGESVAPGLYHFEWDGKAWKRPTALYKGAWHPEFPRLLVHNGNELHAVWFLRVKTLDATEFHEVWYARGFCDAPPLIQPGNGESVTPEIKTSAESEIMPRLDSTPTAIPDFGQDDNRITPDPYSEYDEYLVILISLIPVSLLGVFAFYRSKGRG